MERYKEAYLALFNQMTNLIEELKEIQRKAEEIMMAGDDLDFASGK